MLPEEFQSRMRLQLRDEYEEFLKGLEGERHRALRVNPLKGGGSAGSQGSFSGPEPLAS